MGKSSLISTHSVVAPATVHPNDVSMCCLVVFRVEVHNFLHFLQRLKKQKNVSRQKFHVNHVVFKTCL